MHQSGRKLPWSSTRSLSAIRSSLHHHRRGRQDPAVLQGHRRGRSDLQRRGGGQGRGLSRRSPRRHLPARADQADDPNKGGLLRLLNVDIGLILHGEQHFEYFAPVVVGDKVTCQEKVVDIYDKKGGALWFVVQEMEMKDQSGQAGGQGARASPSCATQTLPRSKEGKMASVPKFDQVKVGDETQAAGAAADQPPPARALLRRLGRSQSDPCRSSTSPRSSVSRTCSRTACCRWPSSAGS